MSTVNLIVAIDLNYGIGYKNQLLCHLPADLQHFKALTTGNPIIMGRKTFESIGKPLPNRLNIVLTSNQIAIEGVVETSSYQAALEIAKDATKVFVIGGAKVFIEALETAQCIYLTKIHHVFEADVFFPKLNPAIWSCTESVYRAADNKNPYDLTFCKYERC